MLTSIATVSISGTLEGKLQAVAAAGYDGVEIFENDLLAFPGSATDVGTMIRDLGLTCTLYQPFRDFEGMPDEMRVRVFDRAERKFDVMQELGTDLVLVCSNVSPAARGDISRIVADFQELGERAAKRGLRVGYEALAWGRHVNDHRIAWDVVRQADHPAVGLILDSFHSLVRRIPIDSLGVIDPAKIFIVQLADAPWLEMDYLSWSRHFRNMPGQGDIPVRAFVSALLEIGYRGPLSLEIFNDRFRAIDASVVAVDGYRALRLSIDEAARFSGLDLPQAMPARVTCSGFEFVEFAVTEEEASELTALLATLGFSLTGRHRSKQVERWQQGEINFVVNSDPEGLAHSYNIMHGPSACAVCVDVDDVPAALGRASELSISSFEGRVGRGEMRIPALRDIGGGLIYLIDYRKHGEFWAKDFHPFDATRASDAGLRRIDHIAYAMSDEEHLSGLLYHFALFDVIKPPYSEVVDPLGLVQVQPVESADGRFRLLLKASAAPRTLAARLAQRYWGAGVQYVSLQTEDIFETARRIADLGCASVPAPSNYYDDLHSKGVLPEATVEEMQSLNIFYDSDEQGEYFQIFTRAFRKRFFFEIVQRRGYRGYGIVNEPIRLAAQARFRELVEDLP